MEAVKQDEFYLNVREVAQRYGVSTPTIWRWMADKRFPQPKRLSAGCSRWPVSTLRDWERSLDGRPAQPAMRRTR